MVCKDKEHDLTGSDPICLVDFCFVMLMLNFVTQPSPRISQTGPLVYCLLGLYRNSYIYIPIKKL